MLTRAYSPPSPPQDPLSSPAAHRGDLYAAMPDVQTICVDAVGLRYWVPVVWLWRPEESGTSRMPDLVEECGQRGIRTTSPQGDAFKKTELIGELHMWEMGLEDRFIAAIRKFVGRSFGFGALKKEERAE
ncbi:hypothetical protein PG984_002682 [Apiospora sp. TS-2023a]